MNEGYQSPMTPLTPPVGPSMPPASSPFMTPPAVKKNWPVWLIVVLVAVAVLAAAYYFYFSPKVYSPPPEVVNMGIMKPKEVTPDEAAAIEADLQTLPLNDLDSELQNIDAELGQPR